MSLDTDVARLEERQRAHVEADEDVHGRMLGEVGNLGRKVDDVARRIEDVDRKVGELSTKLGNLATTLGPVIEHYMAEHPSKVHNLPLRQTPVPPSRRSMLGAMARSYGPFGAIILALQIIAELVKAGVHPAPPPPQTSAQIVAEVKALIAAPAPTPRAASTTERP